MIIECEKCHAKFNLDENLLKETGSKVRCSRCKHVFTAFPPERELQIEEAPAEELEETEELAAEEIFKQEDLLSDLEKTFAQEVEEEVEISEEEEEVEISEEKEEIEAISFDELSQLDSGPIKRAEAERLDTHEAMDRAAQVEQEITAQKEVEREEEVEEVEEQEEPARPRPIIKKRGRSRLWITILLIVHNYWGWSCLDGV